MRGYLFFVVEELVAESTTRGRLGEKVRENTMRSPSGPPYPVASIRSRTKGGRAPEMGGLVELHRDLGILAEHAVDDTDVEKRACGA